MGIGLIWQNSVTLALLDAGIDTVNIGHERYDLLRCNDSVIAHLVPLENDFEPQELIELQAAYQLLGINLVHLWEDIWFTRQKQVIGRIKSLLGLNKRLHGRKGSIVAIDQKQADDFLDHNHIQGTARAKYKFALKIEDRIVAVACFSNTRIMRRIAPDYRSVELIRFATLIGFTVTGGFTKLLKHFIKLVRPNDVMSYADRDWSLGNAYEYSGFQLVSVTPPAQIGLDKEKMIRYFSHRIPNFELNNIKPDEESVAKVDENQHFLPVFNTGNLKYILYLK